MFQVAISSLVYLILGIGCPLECMLEIIYCCKVTFPPRLRILLLYSKPSLFIEHGNLCEHFPPFSVLWILESRMIRVKICAVVKDSLEIVQVRDHLGKPGQVSGWYGFFNVVFQILNKRCFFKPCQKCRGNMFTSESNLMSSLESSSLGWISIPFKVSTMLLMQFQSSLDFDSTSR